MKLAYHIPKGTFGLCAHMWHIINVETPFKIDKISSWKYTWNFFLFFDFLSYFQIWVSYMHIISYQHSYDIIGQKSSIGQKFLPPRAPLLWQKNEENGTYLLFFLLIFQSFNKCCRFKARGVPEISDRSSIFGLWYSKMLQHKTIIVKSFFHDFLWCNISSYQIFICHFGRIFDQKPQFFLYFLSFWPYFQIWVLYMHIISYQHSYDIIGQKSPIGQKFLPPRAPLR